MGEEINKSKRGRPSTSTPERKRELTRLRKLKQTRRDRAAREIGKRLKPLAAYDRQPWLEILAYLFDGSEDNKYAVISIASGSDDNHGYETNALNTDEVIDLLLSDDQVVEVKWY